MIDRSGQQIDNYYLLRFLGRGTYGEVYLAKEQSSGNLVAVKILFQHLDTEQLRNAFNEARMGLLNHPNIVHIKDFGVEGEQPFLVMDYVAGGTLRQRYPGGKQPSLDAIVYYIEQITKALQQIHAFGKVHRDVKPENMLIGPNNEILLSDFGTVITSYTINTINPQIPIGTLSYIAPEQIQMQAVRASDQYSLAATVYEWLTGVPPFVGTPDEILFHHQNTLPLPLRQRVPTISLEIENVIMKALAKDPHQRYTNIEEFAAAFRSAYRFSLTFTFKSHTDGVRTIAWSADSKYIASAGRDESIYLWEAKTGKLVIAHYVHTGEIWGLSWTPHKKYIASAGQDGVIRIWELATNASIFTYETHIGEIHAIAWSPDGKYIASGGIDKTIQIWETTGCFAAYNEHENAIETLSWSPDGKFIVSGDASGMIYVWNILTRDTICAYKNHHDTVTTVSWSPDGNYIASGSWDKTVQVWEAMTGRIITTYKGHNEAIESLSWSPDGNYIASGSWDKTVQVWQATTGKRFFSYNGHESWVNIVTWSPDGNYIASGSWDKTVQVWQAPDNKNGI